MKHTRHHCSITQRSYDCHVHPRISHHDYVGDTWPGRLGLYESVPTSLETINEADLNDLFRQAGQQEAALLSKIGFRYRSQGNGYSFKRVITDAHCTTRIQRVQ
ncbi:hypothetical protein MRI28_30605 [Nocardiopsis dassonvillei]|uniref:hypothetical protein n=1 Tax=Nocardiopsis dassonvillei TaxID=2014 RepID=UPI00200C3F81|nr:hypothetical protein [Nocardiopsis dassonvillei]MCK9873921.1 hypothetical protein [Nocardiopsis dassonvillei]